MKNSVYARIIYSGLLATSLVLAACSAKTTADSLVPSANVPQEAFNDKVTGPNLEGSWSSVCTADYEIYRIKRIVFQGHNITRTSNEYSDSQCANTTRQDTEKGTFRWADKTSYGGFLIEYRFDLGKGITQLTKEEILVENSNLYLSDFASGFGSIDKTVALTKDGAAAQSSTGSPVPANVDPNTTTGIVAKNLKTAKYAFCNLQGTAVILDFNGADLSTSTSGTISAEVRNCNSSDSFKKLDNFKFSLNQDGKFRFDLSYPYEGYVEESYYGTLRANADINGNSGICTFLENKGVKGIFNSDDVVWQCQ